MKRVLIAEDDRSILDVVKIILEGEGYLIESTDNEGRFFRKIENNRPDLVLLDIRLNGHDGGKIAKKLKNKEGTKMIPVVLMSANHEIKLIADSSNADGFLVKPFNIEELIDVVKKYTN